MKRLLMCVAILIAVSAVCSLIARERSILRAAEERVRRAEATARNALKRAQHAAQSSAPAAVFVPPQEEPSFAFPEPAAGSAPVFDFQPAGQVDPVNGLEALRQKYVEQQAVKALLMPSADLQAALDTTNQEIRELDAQTQLKAVSETLAKLVEEFEGTAAAPVAEQMLELYRNPHQESEEPGTTDAADAVESPEPEGSPEAEPAN